MESPVAKFIDPDESSEAVPVLISMDPDLPPCPVKGEERNVMSLDVSAYAVFSRRYAAPSRPQEHRVAVLSRKDAAHSVVVELVDEQLTRRQH